MTGLRLKVVNLVQILAVDEDVRHVVPLAADLQTNLDPRVGKRIA